MELLIPTSEANIGRLAVKTSGCPLVSTCSAAVSERIKVPPNNSAREVSKKFKKKSKSKKRGLLLADSFYKIKANYGRVAAAGMGGKGGRAL